VSSIAPTTPRKVLFSVNQKTAQQIKVSIPEDIMKKARRVY